LDFYDRDFTFIFACHFVCYGVGNETAMNNEVALLGILNNKIDSMKLVFAQYLITLQEQEKEREAIELELKELQERMRNDKIST